MAAACRLSQSLQADMFFCAQAVRTMHRPASLDAVEEARRRLAFDELLTMQLQLLLQRDLSRCTHPSMRLGPIGHLPACCAVVCLSALSSLIYVATP